MTQQNSPQTEPKLTRRDFLKLGANILGAVALLEAAGIGLTYLAPRKIEGEFGGILKAGEIDSFPLGSITEFPAGRFFLARLDDGGFLALYRRCTHLGCSIAWHADQNKFICPCHTSQFDTAGDVENPPAPRALDIFPITFEDGVVIVDTGKIISRDNFEAQQVAYPPAG